MDSVVNFGESLPKKELKAGFHHAIRSDLCLALGSSLRVNPAASMPFTTAERGHKLVIVNLQATPLDYCATLRINGDCDTVMKMLMDRLNLPIPEFVLWRYIRFTRK